MAEDADLKQYASKLKIGGVVYFLKDIEAGNLIEKLNGADTVEGSVLNSIKLYAQNADYAESTLGTALGKCEEKLATLNGDINTDGSVQFQIYHNSKDAIYSVVPAVTREATEDDVVAGLATEVGEVIVVTPAKVTTIQEAIENVANSIGNLTVNGKTLDENMAVTLDSSDIKRKDSEKTIEDSLKEHDTSIAILTGKDTVEGSVLKTVKDKAVDATYEETISTHTESVTLAADNVNDMIGKTVLDYDGTYKTIKSASVVSNDDNGNPTVYAFAYDDTGKYIRFKAGMNTVCRVGTPFEVTYKDDTTTRVTIGDAIASVTDKADTVTARVDILESDATVVGSIKNTVKSKGGEADFKFASSDTTTTLAKAIQSNYDLIQANKNGSFKVVNAIDVTNGTYTVEASGEPKAISKDDYGTIFLVSHDGEDNAAGEKVATHYDEYIVIEVSDGNLKLEKIGDTEITLDGYATQTWVTENAKDAIFSNTKTYYHVANENGGESLYITHDGQAHTGDTLYHVVDGELVVVGTVNEVEITSQGKIIYRSDASQGYLLDVKSYGTTQVNKSVTEKVTIKEAIESIENALYAHITALDTRINASNSRISSLETSVVKKVNGIAATDNEIVVEAKDIDYITKSTHTVTEEESNDESSPYYGKETNSVVEVPATTVKDALDTNKVDIAKEAERAKGVEDAINAKVTDLQEKVTGTTVKSVNGVEATKENGGAIVIDDKIINHSDAVGPTYYVAEDEEVIAGTKVAGDIKTAGKDAVTIHDAIEDKETRIAKIENATLTQTINDVDSEITGSFSDGIIIKTVLDSKDIKMDKSADESVSIFDKINGIINSNAQAITSVAIKENTGTWAVDVDDAEQLNWVDTQLETSDATFLVPNTK